MSVGRHRIHSLNVRRNRLRDVLIPNPHTPGMTAFYKAELAALDWVLGLFDQQRPSTARSIIDTLAASVASRHWDGRSMTGAAHQLRRAGITWDDFACGVVAGFIAMSPSMDPT